MVAISDLTKAHLCKESDLQGSDLRGIELPNGSLVGAKLSGAKLDDANLAGADLTRADLSGVRLSEAVLRDAILREARLNEAVFYKTDLRKADLTSAKGLRGAALFDAFMEGAILDNVDLRGAKLPRPYRKPRLKEQGFLVMTADICRREFTRLSAAALTYLPISAWAQQSQSTHIFLHQHGGPEIFDFYLGALITDNPQQHRDAMKSIREAVKYDRILMYKSSDKYKYEFSCRLIDYFLAARNIRFVGGNVKLDHWPDSARNKDLVYFGVHKKLFEFSRLDPESSPHVHTINRGFSRRSRNLFKKFETELPWRTRPIWNFPTKEPLLQIADFFTGSLKDDSGDHTKERLLIYLRQALKVDRLTQANLRDHQAFRIRDILA
jgi:hypothetical protein